MKPMRSVSKANLYPICRMILLIALAFAGTYGIMGTIAQTEMLRFTNSFAAFLLFALNLYILRHSLPLFFATTTHHKVYAVLFAFVLSGCLHFGSRLESVENVPFTDIGMWISILLFASYSSVLLHALWEWMMQQAVKCKEKTGFCLLTDRFFVTAICIFLMWLPVFLAFFPGAFVYDAQEEYVEVASRIFTTHHPLLHVLLLGGSIRLFEHFGVSANAGIACYTLFQMAVLSSILAYFLRLLKKWGVALKYRIGTMLFLGLFPIFPMYAVCTAKDTLFTGFFFLSVLLMIDMTKGTMGNWQIALFTISSVLMMLLRNNGMYAYALAIPFLAWAFKRSKNMRKLCLFMVLSIALYFAGAFALKTVLHASDEEHQEMLTVPIQQLTRAYTYAPEIFSKEDRQTLYEILPEEALRLYNPRVSDLVKSQFDNDAYVKNPAKYRSLWLKIGVKKPLVYLNAWFMTSYGYWYPDMILNVYGGNQMYTYQYRDSSYFGFETEPPGERHSLFPALEEFYRKISLELFQQKVPVVSMFFAPGFVFWVFFTTFTLLLRERKKTAVFFVPVLLLWLTVIVGPTILVRYVLILWFMIPLLPVLVADISQ